MKTIILVLSCLLSFACGPEASAPIPPDAGTDAIALCDYDPCAAWRPGECQGVLRFEPQNCVCACLDK